MRRGRTFRATGLLSRCRDRGQGILGLIVVAVIVRHRRGFELLRLRLRLVRPMLLLSVLEGLTASAASATASPPATPAAALSIALARTGLALTLRARGLRVRCGGRG